MEKKENKKRKKLSKEKKSPNSKREKKLAVTEQQIVILQPQPIAPAPNVQRTTQSTFKTEKKIIVAEKQMAISQPQSTAAAPNVQRTVQPSGIPLQENINTKAKGKTQMVLLRRKYKAPLKEGDSHLPVSDCHLLEIQSNCEWSSIRSSVLSKMSLVADRSSYPKPARFMVGDYEVAILEKPDGPTKIPPHLQKSLSSKEMIPIKLFIRKPQDEVIVIGEEEPSEVESTSETATPSNAAPSPHNVLVPTTQIIQPSSTAHPHNVLVPTTHIAQPVNIAPYPHNILVPTTQIAQPSSTVPYMHNILLPTTQMTQPSNTTHFPHNVLVPITQTIQPSTAAHYPHTNVPSASAQDPFASGISGLGQLQLHFTSGEQSSRLERAGDAAGLGTTMKDIARSSVSTSHRESSWGVQANSTSPDKNRPLQTDSLPQVVVKTGTGGKQIVVQRVPKAPATEIPPAKRKLRLDKEPCSSPEFSKFPRMDNEPTTAVGPGELSEDVESVSNKPTLADGSRKKSADHGSITPESQAKRMCLEKELSSSADSSDSRKMEDVETSEKHTVRILSLKKNETGGMDGSSCDIPEQEPTSAVSPMELCEVLPISDKPGKGSGKISAEHVSITDKAHDIICVKVNAPDSVTLPGLETATHRIDTAEDKITSIQEKGRPDDADGQTLSSKSIGSDKTVKHILDNAAGTSVEAEQDSEPVETSCKTGSDDTMPTLPVRNDSPLDEQGQWQNDLLSLAAVEANNFALGEAVIAANAEEQRKDPASKDVNADDPEECQNDPVSVDVSADDSEEWQNDLINLAAQEAEKHGVSVDPEEQDKDKEPTKDCSSETAEVIDLATDGKETTKQQNKPASLPAKPSVSGAPTEIVIQDSSDEDDSSECVLTDTVKTLEKNKPRTTAATSGGMPKQLLVIPSHQSQVSLKQQATKKLPVPVPLPRFGSLHGGSNPAVLSATSSAVMAVTAPGLPSLVPGGTGTTRLVSSVPSIQCTVNKTGNPRSPIMLVPVRLMNKNLKKTVVSASPRAAMGGPVSGLCVGATSPRFPIVPVSGMKSLPGTPVTMRTVIMGPPSTSVRPGSTSLLKSHLKPIQLQSNVELIPGQVSDSIPKVASNVSTMSLTSAAGTVTTMMANRPVTSSKPAQSVPCKAIPLSDEVYKAGFVDMAACYKAANEGVGIDCEVMGETQSGGPEKIITTVSKHVVRTAKSSSQVESESLPSEIEVTVTVDGEKMQSKMINLGTHDIPPKETGSSQDQDIHVMGVSLEKTGAAVTPSSGSPRAADTAGGSQSHCRIMGKQIEVMHDGRSSETKEVTPTPTVMLEEQPLISGISPPGQKNMTLLSTTSEGSEQVTPVSCFRICGRSIQSVAQAGSGSNLEERHMTNTVMTYVLGTDGETQQQHPQPPKVGTSTIRALGESDKLNGSNIQSAGDSLMINVSESSNRNLSTLRSPRPNVSAEFQFGVWKTLKRPPGQAVYHGIFKSRTQTMGGCVMQGLWKCLLPEPGQKCWQGVWKTMNLQPGYAGIWKSSSGIHKGEPLSGVWKSLDDAPGQPPVQGMWKSMPMEPWQTTLQGGWKTTLPSHSDPLCEKQWASLMMWLTETSSEKVLSSVPGGFSSKTSTGSMPALESTSVLRGGLNEDQSSRSATSRNTKTSTGSKAVSSYGRFGEPEVIDVDDESEVEKKEEYIQIEVRLNIHVGVCIYISNSSIMGVQNIGRVNM